MEKAASAGARTVTILTFHGCLLERVAGVVSVCLGVLWHGLCSAAWWVLSVGLLRVAHLREHESYSCLRKKIRMLWS